MHNRTVDVVHYICFPELCLEIRLRYCPKPTTASITVVCPYRLHSPYGIEARRQSIAPLVPMAEDQSSTDVTPDHTDSTPTPRTHVDSAPLPTDSLVTISLSEASRLSSSTTGLDSAVLAVPEADLSEDSKRRSSLDITSGVHDDIQSGETPNDVAHSDRGQSADWTRSASSGISGLSKDWSHSISDRSDRSIEVDWEELDEREEREDADAESDEVACLQRFNCSDTDSNRLRLSFWLDSSKKIMLLRATRNPDKRSTAILNRDRRPYTSYARWCKKKVHAQSGSRYFPTLLR